GTHRHPRRPPRPQRRRGRASDAPAPRAGASQHPQPHPARRSGRVEHIMNTERVIDRALAHIDQDAVTQLAVDLVSISSPTGAEREVATFVAERMARGGLEVTLQDIGPTGPTPW